MFKSKGLKAGAFSAALALVLIGCASEPDEEASTEVEAGTETEIGTEDIVAGDNDLIIGKLSDATSLDPHTSSDIPSGNIQTNLYETLVRYDTDMVLEPYLATEWEAVEEDVWEFTLREDVYFHDGTEFNADVVKANIERILDPDLGSPRAILLEIIDDVIVVDDHTVQFVTEDPFAPLPAHLAHYSISMISPDVIEGDYAAVEDGAQYGDYVNEHPYGTGFFTFDTWESGSQITLQPNDEYWGDHVRVDSVIFKVVPEDLTRIGELETGASHIIDPVNPADLARLEASDGVAPYVRNAASITYLGFNVEKEPFDDPKVRRAVAKVVDKEAILDGIVEGTGEEAVGPVNNTNFGYSENVEKLERDIEAAKELLAEAGYEDGFETTIWTNDNRERIDIAELTQAELAQIGIDVEIEVLEWGAYLDATAAGEHDMFILGLTLGTGDADYPMHMLFHSDSIGNGNRSQMNDPVFDEMLYEARIEQDEDTRLALYEDATNYLLEQSPMVFLYHPAHTMGVSDQVEGFWADASGLYQLQDVELNN
ncbi:glutathione ABC transporter substrate-binding protein [Bacillus shivajii]|uniref:glutathione ABC transporter substrate-binding protein n=1 Tax=Bacillus shivajii TaxID=1983719 RepID=UPI001CFBBBD3|nr:glutathione ABC transporter substrate-binding protein [Bacillus shivajii]UCZ52844.1 glutathione ABC transporter substrate-binding protein [Bacillus shivajii]